MTFNEMKQVFCFVLFCFFFLWWFRLVSWFCSNEIVAFNASSWSQNGIKCRALIYLHCTWYLDKWILTRISTEISISPGGYPGIFPSTNKMYSHYGVFIFVFQKVSFVTSIFEKYNGDISFWPKTTIFEKIKIKYFCYFSFKLWKKKKNWNSKN